MKSLLVFFYLLPVALLPAQAQNSLVGQWQCDEHGYHITMTFDLDFHFVCDYTYDDHTTRVEGTVKINGSSIWLMPEQTDLATISGEFSNEEIVLGSGDVTFSFIRGEAAN